MKILSLFDGISCARVALERAGIPVEAYYASEIDKYAMQVSAKNYPDTIHLGDIKNILPQHKIEQTRHSKFIPKLTYAENIYLLIGGSPCQDLSIAKKNRKGLDGERSGLFWEYVRILKEVKPKYFILENVNSMPKEAKQLITETLGVEPIMINASLVSAQNRKRLFWTNIPNVNQPADRGILLKDILEENVDEKYHTKNVTLIKGGTDKKTDLDFIGGIRNKDWAKDGKNYSRNFGQGDRVYSPNGKATTLSALGGGRGAKTGLYMIDKNLNAMVSLKNGKQSKLDDRTLESKKKLRQKVGNLCCVQKEKENRYTSQKRKLARQQDREFRGNVSELSLPITSSNKNMQGKELQQETQGEGILRQTFSKVQKDRKSNGNKLEKWEDNDFVIRKLSCVECERLQSLPDNYTDGVSNSQRYKMLGNAFNVDVVAHILSFIN